MAGFFLGVAFFLGDVCEVGFSGKSEPLKLEHCSVEAVLYSPFIQ